VKDSPEVLYEEYFHCTNLVTQIKAAILKFRASPAFATGVPNTEDGIVLPFLIDLMNA